MDVRYPHRIWIRISLALVLLHSSALLAGVNYCKTDRCESADAEERVWPVSRLSHSITVLAGGISLTVPGQPSRVAHLPSFLLLDYGEERVIGLTVDTPDTLSQQLSYLREHDLTIAEWTHFLFTVTEQQASSLPGRRAAAWLDVASMKPTYFRGARVFSYQNAGLQAYRVLDARSLPHPDTTLIVVDDKPNRLITLTFSRGFDEKARNAVIASIAAR